MKPWAAFFALIGSNFGIGREPLGQPSLYFSVYGLEVDYLKLLHAELDSFAEYIDDDLSVPIPTCGQWTLYDLVDHMGAGNLWVVAAIQEGHGNFRPERPAPRNGLAQWYTDTATQLLDALNTDPDTTAWTFHPPHTVGFWQRRRFQETLMHRWDAGAALGRPPHIAPEHAGDGIDEVLEVMIPRLVDRGKRPPLTQTVQLTAHDLDDATWILGPGEPDASATATASELLLALWQRIPRESLDWQGNPATLSGPLTQ